MPGNAPRPSLRGLTGLGIHWTLTAIPSAEAAGREFGSKTPWAGTQGVQPKFPPSLAPTCLAKSWGKHCWRSPIPADPSCGMLDVDCSNGLRIPELLQKKMALQGSLKPQTLLHPCCCRQSSALAELSPIRAPAAFPPATDPRLLQR